MPKVFPGFRGWTWYSHRVNWANPWYLPHRQVSREQRRGAAPPVFWGWRYRGNDREVKAKGISGGLPACGMRRVWQKFRSERQPGHENLLPAPSRQAPHRTFAEGSLNLHNKIKTSPDMCPAPATCLHRKVLILYQYMSRVSLRSFKQWYKSLWRNEASERLRHLIKLLSSILNR